ncbi:uncharacterized protein LOC120106681 [Phoenix dactylifera]|uniref:Uncharacterized protein LOC103701618 n=1 Tax=Phoenix dactylifera TaxID=42345 RepID=A0A8B8ZW98_PHODC|nr:uncharacterized protein LOC103701618 [Phoenix dactylifera]XP_038975644.1 uncharacterized protein LOC120106681 [Phoenix dactylifera]
MASPMITNRTPISCSLLFGASFPSSSSSLSSLQIPARARNRRASGFRIRAETMATEKLGIKIERNPPESKLAELGVRQWPKWGCAPSKFPWTYTAKETCYLLEGKVKVYPDGHGDEFVEIGPGDLVEFPKGMKCTWDVSVAVDKHYNFD